MTALNSSVAYSSSKASFKLLNLGVIFQDQSAQLEKKFQRRNDNTGTWLAIFGLIEFGIAIVVALCTQSARCRRLFR
jgi:hypothetical protein